MGRKAKHTQAEVFAAADQLVANGQEVTPTVLLATLGGGSLTTIYKHLDAWNEARKDAPAPVVIEMPAAAQAAFSQVWQMVSNEAGKEIAKIREEADAKLKDASRQLAEARANIEILENEAEAEAGRIETLESDLAGEREASQNAATAAAARESALVATVKQQQEQIAAQQEELARVHSDAEATRKHHSAELARLDAALQTSQAEAIRLRDEVTARQAELAGEREASQNAATAAAVRESALVATVKQQQEQIAAQQVELARVQSDAEATRQHHSDELARLDAIIKTSQAEATRLRDEATARQAELATAQAGAERLAEKLKDQKERSADAILKIENAKNKQEAELTETRKEARALEKSLALATGELTALRAQVAAFVVMPAPAGPSEKWTPDNVG